MFSANLHAAVCQVDRVNFTPLPPQSPVWFWGNAMKNKIVILGAYQNLEYLNKVHAYIHQVSNFMSIE